MVSGNETSDVVGPVLQALAILGFYVVKSKKDGYQAAAVAMRQSNWSGVVWRQNTGRAMLTGRGGEERPVAFGIPGQSDIAGIMRGGRTLAIECKKPGGKVSPDQAAYLEIVRTLGGVGLLSHGAEDILARKEILCGDCNPAKRPRRGGS